MNRDIINFCSTVEEDGFDRHNVDWEEKGKSFKMRRCECERELRIQNDFNFRELGMTMIGNQLVRFIVTPTSLE